MEYFLRVYIALYYFVSGLHNFLESSESPSCLTITRVKRIKDNDVSVLKLKGAFNYVRSKDTLTFPMRAPGVLQAFDKLLCPQGELMPVTVVGVGWSRGILSKLP